MNPLKRRTTWLIWSFLFLAFIFMAGFIMGNASNSINKVATNESCAIPLDLHIFGVSPEEASKVLDCMGIEGRRIYKQVAIREDVFYPAIYCLFFSFTLFALSAFILKNKQAVWILTTLPFIILIADLFENYYVVTLIDQFPSMNKEAVTSFTLVNTIKWSILFLVFSLIIFFGAWSIAKLISKKSASKS